jgi:uncharacterized coiled-coil DUF342 family protein
MLPEWIKRLFQGMLVDSVTEHIEATSVKLNHTRAQLRDFQEKIFTAEVEKILTEYSSKDQRERLDDALEELVFELDKICTRAEKVKKEVERLRRTLSGLSTPG